MPTVLVFASLELLDLHTRNLIFTHILGRRFEDVKINQNWPSELSNQVMFFLNRQQIIEHSDGQECLLLLGHHFCVNGNVAAKKFGVNISEVWRFGASWQHIRSRKTLYGNKQKTAFLLSSSFEGFDFLGLHIVSFLKF